MPSSDSDDFESADEGHNTPDKKERRKRNSSSNYSDNALESEQSLKVSTSSTNSKIIKPASVEKVETTDGWDDFDIDESETITLEPTTENTKECRTEHTSELNSFPSKKIKEDVKSKDTGWDDFDDWGQGDFSSKQLPSECSTHQVEPNRDIKEVTDRLAATTTNSSSWGWGWGVDSLLSSATAGFTTITNQVSQGISTVLETGIGAPDPEELAKQRTKETENKESTINNDNKGPINKKQVTEDVGESNDVSFPFGSLLSGVTKFVETTGTKVIAGGLDTLETIGKKTMEVLQDGDPGLAKKRAMLGLDPGDKPVLSQVLREAKARADEEDRIREERREAKEVHYENLFDDFEGLVHLEALEMLSRQVNMRIEERIRTADPRKKQEIKETLQQVSELCEMPEEDDEPEESVDSQLSKSEGLQERLQSATRDLGIKVQFQPLIKQYTEMIEWCSGGDCECPRAVYKRGVSSLAQATALAVELYHKGAEMLLVKTRRSTADETDALTQMTVVLTKHISEIATLFTEKLNSISTEDKQQINTYITNIFLEAGNSSTYIQNAFQLALPILQIGAV